MAKLTKAEFSRQVYQAALNAGMTDAAARVTAGQAAIESNFGTKIPGNNFFGVKAGKSWTGPTQMLWTHETDKDGVSHKVQQSFRVYDSFDAAMADRVRVMDHAWPGFSQAKSVGEALDILPHGKYGEYYTGSKYDYEKFVTGVDTNYLGGTPTPPGDIPGGTAVGKLIESADGRANKQKFDPAKIPGVIHPDAVAPSPAAQTAQLRLDRGETPYNPDTHGDPNNAWSPLQLDNPGAPGLDRSLISAGGAGNDSKKAPNAPNASVNLMDVAHQANGTVMPMPGRPPSIDSVKPVNAFDGTTSTVAAKNAGTEQAGGNILTTLSTLGKTLSALPSVVSGAPTQQSTQTPTKAAAGSKASTSKVSQATGDGGSINLNKVANWGVAGATGVDGALPVAPTPPPRPPVSGLAGLVALVGAGGAQHVAAPVTTKKVVTATVPQSQIDRNQTTEVKRNSVGARATGPITAPAPVDSGWADKRAALFSTQENNPVAGFLTGIGKSLSEGVDNLKTAGAQALESAGPKIQAAKDATIGFIMASPKTRGAVIDPMIAKLFTTKEYGVANNNTLTRESATAAKKATKAGGSAAQVTAARNQAVASSDQRGQNALKASGMQDEFGMIR